MKHQIPQHAFRLGPDITLALAPAREREWLETNGLGGFAASTVAGLNTRRYHGLLVAATTPPVGRAVLLSKLEETLVIDGRRFELGANRYPGVVHPTGYRHLVEFRLDPFPIFTYEVAGMRLEKTVFMRHGENTTVVTYTVAAAGAPGRGTAVALEVRPLIAFRDYHSTTHENAAIDRRVETKPGLATVAPYAGLPALHIAHDAAALDERGDWYRHFEYDVERERGLDHDEDLFNPFTLHFDLSTRPTATVVASTAAGRTAASAGTYRAAEIERRATVARGAAAAAGNGDLVPALAAAADQFLVARDGGQTVIAGYPWFTDWGRDTMIALPGLTLVTGRHAAARDILLAFAAVVDRGMLPNRFPDAGAAPEYNTVDATLWFFAAVHAYLEYSGDRAFVRDEIYPVLADIVRWHLRGTRYGIHVDEDGLLAAGEPGVQLTWMDAKIGDWVVTPRQGKAVEIQALWYNALRIMEELSREFDPGAIEHFGNLARLVMKSFNELFWNEETGCLCDVVDGPRRDGSIRPNQIFAVSLRHPIVGGERARQVVATVERELLTPVGLRSLARGSEHYAPGYSGGPRERDAAYHQGTVWSWLLGPFITAYLKVHGRSGTALRRADACLDGIRAHLVTAGLGQISEIFDAEPPHHPRGCFAQAWSVAEILRAAVEDIAGRRPTPMDPAPPALVSTPAERM